MREKTKNIAEAIKKKACMKQDVYKNTRDLFDNLYKEATLLVDQLSKENEDERVIIDLNRISDFEFRLTVGGDLLAFTMQTNIFLLPTEHPAYKTKYIKGNQQRAYFGQIMVYNFLADSLKYNRKKDVGYLVSRIFVNLDNHFYLEGMKNLTFSYPNISKNLINESFADDILREITLLAIDTDIVFSSYKENFQLTVEEKTLEAPRLPGQKLGFQMSADRSSK